MFLLNHPDMQTSRLIKHQLQHEINLELATKQVTEIKQLADGLKVSGIKRKLRRCRHHDDLRRLRRRLQHQASDAILLALQNVELQDLSKVLQNISHLLSDSALQHLKVHWFERCESPLKIASESIIPITSYQTLFLEAHQQHNCAMVNWQWIQSRAYAICKVLEPERATLCINVLLLNKGCQFGYLKQLLLKANKPVAPDTYLIIDQFFKNDFWQYS
jgi:hypothetical protein